MHEAPQPKKIPSSGTLRLSPEQRIGTWKTWTERVRKEMAAGDLERAAHTLACCMVGPDTPPDELEQARAMFLLPELAPFHQQLWDLIVADNELVYDDGKKQVKERWADQEKIANFLFDEFGWKIE